MKLFSDSSLSTNAVEPHPIDSSIRTVNSGLCYLTGQELLGLKPLFNYPLTNLLRYRERLLNAQESGNPMRFLVMVCGDVPQKKLDSLYYQIDIKLDQFPEPVVLCRVINLLGNGESIKDYLESIGYPIKSNTPSTKHFAILPRFPNAGYRQTLIKYCHGVMTETLTKIGVKPTWEQADHEMDIMPKTSFRNTKVRSNVKT